MLVIRHLQDVKHEERGCILYFDSPTQWVSCNSLQGPVFQGLSGLRLAKISDSWKIVKLEITPFDGVLRRPSTVIYILRIWISKDKLANPCIYKGNDDRINIVLSTTKNGLQIRRRERKI